MTMRYKMRKVDGRLCRCCDVGCDDFDQAAQNRKMVKEGLYTSGYIQSEIAISKTPLDRPLASWIPTGELPTIAKEIWRGLSGVHVEDFDREAIKVVDVILTRHMGDVV